MPSGLVGPLEQMRGSWNDDDLLLCLQQVERPRFIPMTVVPSSLRSYAQAKSRPEGGVKRESPSRPRPPSTGLNHPRPGEARKPGFPVDFLSPSAGQSR